MESVVTVGKIMMASTTAPGRMPMPVCVPKMALQAATTT